MRGGDPGLVLAPDPEKSEWGLVSPVSLPKYNLRIYAVWSYGDPEKAADLAEKYRENPNLRFMISLARLTASQIVVDSPGGARRVLPLPCPDQRQDRPIPSPLSIQCQAAGTVRRKTRTMPAHANLARD